MRFLAFSLLIDLCYSHGLSNDVWTQPWTAYAQYGSHDTTVVPNTKVDYQKMRGSSLIVTSDITGSTVYTSYPKTDDTLLARSFFDGAVLTTPDAEITEGFGSDIALGWKKETGNVLFVSSVDIAASRYNGGYVYLYKGMFSAWSVQQTLQPPREFVEESYFGAAIDLDDEDQRELVVGCKGCNITGSDFGALYVYEPTSPESKRWSQTAVLTTTRDLYYMGESLVQISGDIIVADVKDDITPTAVTNIVVFSKEGPRKWSQQQELNVGPAQIQRASDVTVYDEAIIVGAGFSTVATFTNAGQVNIYYPSTEKFRLKPKGKPKPVQWSVQQVLHSPIPAQDKQFGDSVSIDGNRLAITEGGSAGTSVYLYRREETHGKWSLQQTLVNDPAGFATDVKLIDNSVVSITSGGPSIEVWDETSTWDCLVISMEDHFNDGWDEAYLEVTTPDGQKDIFMSRCDTPNPYQFRYCPSEEELYGDFTFEVKDWKKAKFNWEIIWRVFQESDASWITGKWDTKLEFYWSKSKMAFEEKKMERELPNNVSCHVCTEHPTASPTRAPSYSAESKLRSLRHSHSKDNTFAPTLSPAPTMSQSISATPWQEVHLMTTSPAQWFDAQHRGTSYYVADKHGHRLLYTGTMCPDERFLAYKSCWVGLDDGEYIFRVGGALDRHAADHTVTFCSSTFEMKQERQVIFRVTGGGDHCEIISDATSLFYCSRDLKVEQLASMQLDIFGTFSSSLISGDYELIEESVSSAFPLATAKVREVIQTSYGYAVKVETRVDTRAAGFNAMDADSMDAYVTYIKGDLDIKQAKVQSALMSFTTFQNVRSVHINSVQLLESREVQIHEAHNDFVSDFTDEKSVDTAPSSGDSWSSLGFVFQESALVSVMLLIGMGGVVVYAVSARVLYPVASDTAIRLGNKIDDIVYSFSPKKKKKKGTKKKKMVSQTNADGSSFMMEVSDSDCDSDVESTSSLKKNQKKSKKRSAEPVDLNQIRSMIEMEDRWLASINNS